MNIFKCKYTPLICKILCAVLAALIIFLVWFVCSTNNNISALDKKIDKLTSQSAKTEKQLNTKLKEANATIEKNEKQLQEYRELINKLKAENAEQAALIGELQTPLNGRDEKTAEPADTKIAYLTFDDGPSEHTEEILKVLSERGAVGTFFVINNQYIDKAAAIQKQGSALAMHTATHDYKTIYSSVDAYFTDLYMIESKIYEVAGVKPKIMRLPGGSSNTISKQYASGVVTQIVERLNTEGYIYFDWNVDSTDASAESVPAATLLEKIKAACTDKPVVNILMHDTDQKKTTLEALPLIIDYLRSEGYQFMTLSPTSTVIHHDVNN